MDEVTTEDKEYLVTKDIVLNTNSAFYLEDEYEDYDVDLVVKRIRHKNKDFKFIKPEFMKDLVTLYQTKDFEFSVEDENYWWYYLLSNFNRPGLKKFTYHNPKFNEMILPLYIKAIDNLLEYAQDIKDVCDSKSKSDNGLNSDEKDDKDSDDSGSSCENPNMQPNSQSKSKSKNQNDSKQDKQDNNNADGQGNSNDSNSNDDLNNYDKDKKEQEIEDLIQATVDKLNEDIDQTIKEADLEELDVNSSGSSASKEDSEITKTKEGLEKIKNLKKTLGFSKNALNNFIRKTVNTVKSNNFIKNKTEKIDFFNLNDYGDLQDIYNFALPMNFIEEVYGLEDSYKLTVDFYIDVSGSMSTNVLVNNNPIYLPDICKYLIYKFAKNRLLNDIYVFDMKVIPITIDDFLNHRFSGGGTSIENAIQKVIKNNKPSIIVTDGKDTFYTYSPNVFLLFVEKDAFEAVRKDKREVIREYVSKGQIMGYFNGNFKKL